MPRLKMTVSTETLRLKKPFHIANFVWEGSDVVVVTLQDREYQGRGEGGGVFFLGDDIAHMRAALEEHRDTIEGGPSRDDLREIMPAGGARNAVDCALWELEAERAGKSVWQLAGVSEPKALRTTFTLGADTPEAMAKGALDYAEARSIKIKLTGDLDLDLARVRAIREAREDAWLGVDGNQGFTIDQLPALIEGLVACDISLLEQPLARGHDDELEQIRSSIAIAADESVLTLADVPTAVGRFAVINIKLDKCGGLTEGLLMAAEARRLGLGVMIGNMIGSSLAMAPAYVLGQGCDIVDLDGPTFLAADRVPSVVYREGTISSGPEVWGGGAGVIQ